MITMIKNHENHANQVNQGSDNEESRIAVLGFNTDFRGVRNRHN